MKYLIIFSIFLILCSESFSDSKKDYVGLYVSQKDPEEAVIILKMVDGKLKVVDPKGKKKFEDPIKTDMGIVLVEGDQDKNAFRIRFDDKDKCYYLEKIGSVKNGKLITEVITFKLKLIKKKIQK